MFLELILTVLLFFLVWFRLRWVSVRDYWAKRGVPHYPPHPIMGSLTFLQKQNPTYWMRRLYNDFKAPYVGIWLFWQPGLVINSPELARRILVKDADNFRNRFLSSGANDPIGGLNLFTVNDPIWTSLRRRLTSVFTAAKLRAVQGIINRKVKDLMERIRQDIENGELIDLRKTYTDFTTDVTGESSFGITSEATKNRSSVMRKVTLEMMHFSTYRGLCWSSIFFYPSLVDIFGFTFFPRQTTDLLRQVFRTIIEQRGGFSKEVKECADLLDALIKMKQEAAADGQEMSEDFLLAQAAIFLFGGFETSAAILTWLTYEMAHRPSYQEKLYQELLEAKQSLNGGDFDSTLLAELPYVNAVIKETLRKFPTMGWLDRITSRDYKLDDHLTVPAGTVIYVNATSMQMDPDYFPEPETFDPERFMPENEKNIKPYTFLPFGDGPRSCIGQRFAYQTIRLSIAPLFLTYRLSAVPHSPLPNECSVETKGLFFLPNEKMSVIFTPRI